MTLKLKRRSLHPAEQYAQDVISGRIVVCKLVMQACKRYFYDKKNASKRDLYFDENDAQWAIDFIERYCRHSKGEWAGKSFILESWEKFIVWNIFGWKNKDHYRRFKTVYLELARKNGKTSLLAAIGLLLFVADGEAGAECYSAAVKKDQAIITHSEATRMVKKSPALAKKIGIFRNNLCIESTESKFEPLGRDSDSSDGLNVHCAIVDELHAHKTGDMWGVLKTAIGSRRQPLQLAITTAGFDRNSICWQQHEYLEKILNDVDKDNPFLDDTYFGMIYTIDEKDDWQDEKCWVKANPNLGVSVLIDNIRSNALKAKEVPSEQNEFLRKHLDKWVQQSVREIDMDLWSANFHRNIIEKEFYGKKCFGGLDLSSVSDLTSWSIIFPDPVDPDYIDILMRFWCPEAQIHNRHNQYRNFYEAWHREGFLKITTGDAIDYEDVKAQILDDARKFNLIEMGVDALFQGYQLSMEISKELGKRIVDGKPQERVIAVGMGYQTMTPTMRELEKRLLLRKFNHGNHPVLRWCAENLAVKIDPTGGKKPDKSSSQGKIDGIVSSLIALSRIIKQPIENIGSKYEREALVTM